MFYEEQQDSHLRFGDIISEQEITYLRLKEEKTYNSPNSNLCLSKPKFSVVITPCCSISNSQIALTPLIEIEPKTYRNEYFAEDVTRINKLIPANKKVPSEIFKKMTPIEQSDMLRSGSTFEFLDFFVYEKMDLFDTYKIKCYWDKENNMPNITVQDHMIDFRIISHVISQNLNKTSENLLLRKKVAQLSKISRSSLRDKISSYYAKAPIEDSE